MGSGKSTVGRLVAARAGVPSRDLDAMIEERCGMTVGELFATSGEAAFRALEAALLPEALRPGAVVALGGGTAVAAANWALIRERAITVWLDAPLGVLLPRATAQGGRPLLAGGTETVRALWEARRDRYREARWRVDASRPAAVVAEEVLGRWLGEPR